MNTFLQWKVEYDYLLNVKAMNDPSMDDHIQTKQDELITKFTHLPKKHQLQALKYIDSQGG